MYRQNHNSSGNRCCNADGIKSPATARTRLGRLPVDSVMLYATVEAA